MNRREFFAGASAIGAAASFQLDRRGMGMTAANPPSRRVPIVDVTDLYHPFQDPGDNLDLVHAFAFSEVDLRAVILDVTDAFRHRLANISPLLQDSNGPREPGIVPVTQLNYVFDRQVPYAMGPFTAMRSADDKMLDIPAFQQTGIHLLLDTLKASEQPVEILSFGSTRAIAVAFNRNPDLMRSKVRRIHISAGTAAPGSRPGRSPASGRTPGIEWNVALDPWAFIALLKSGIPIALYPCATQNGPFAYGTNNTFWQLKDLSFVSRLDPRLRNYAIYALARMNRPDFLACLDGKLSIEAASILLAQPHNIWETAVWLNVTRQKLIRRADGVYAIVASKENIAGSSAIENSLLPCDIQVRDDGSFSFEIGKRSNFSIFQRGDPREYEAASREAFTAFWLSIRTAKA